MPAEGGLNHYMHITPRLTPGATIFISGAEIIPLATVAFGIRKTDAILTYLL